MKRLLPIVCNQAFTLLIGLIGVKLISRWVPPAVYGPYALLLTLTQLSTTLSHAGLFNHLIRNWRREQDRAGTYSRFIWRAFWRDGGLLAVVLGAVGLAVFAFRPDPVWLWSLPALFAVNLAGALAALAQGAFNAEERQWRMLGVSALATASRVLLPLMVVVLLGATLAALISGLALHALLMGVFVVLLFRNVADAPDADAQTLAGWRQTLRDYGRPYLWMGVGGWLLQSADRWIVAAFFGEEQAGLFALASSLGGIIPAMAAAGLLQWVFPKMFRMADQARTPADWRNLAARCDWLTLLFLAVSLAGLGALSAIGPHFVGWLIDVKYEPAMPLLLWTGLAVVSVQVNQFHYLLLQGRQNSAAMVWVMTVVAGVKTLGSVAAAAISWPCFLGWLGVSALLSAALGRSMIRHYALTKP